MSCLFACLFACWFVCLSVCLPFVLFLCVHWFVRSLVCLFVVVVLVVECRVLVGKMPSAKAVHLDDGPQFSPLKTLSSAMCRGVLKNQAKN